MPTELPQDVRWFLQFCLQEELASVEQATTLCELTGDSIDLASIANGAWEQGWFADEATWQAYVEGARYYADQGYQAEPLSFEATPGMEQTVTASEGVQAAGSEDVIPDVGKDLILPASETPDEAGIPDFSALDGADPDMLLAAMRSLLAYGREMGASDIHLCAGSCPFARINRAIHYLSDEPLSPMVAERLNLSFLDEKKLACFDREQDFDYVLVSGENQRVRVNLMREHTGVGGVYHLIPAEIITLEELGFKNPGAIHNLLTYHNGLILVTGPVGSGKTTTLATLVNELNWNREAHIVTLEDPIEFVHESHGCLVTQRQIGTHSRSFESAIKSALREDPDIIVIGELRSLSSIEMAVTAAETGHLVIGSMHTKDAVTTLARLLEVFPPRQQPQLRSMMAGSLRGVVCQRLLPSTEGGVALAWELLINNNAVGNLIREGKELELKGVMQTGKKQGMRTMDDAVYMLWQGGAIESQTARAHLDDNTLKQQITD